MGALVHAHCAALLSRCGLGEIVDRIRFTDFRDLSRAQAIPIQENIIIVMSVLSQAVPRRRRGGGDGGGPGAAAGAHCRRHARLLRRPLSARCPA